MKKILKYLPVIAIAAILPSCSAEDELKGGEAAAPEGGYVYKLHLDASIDTPAASRAEGDESNDNNAIAVDGAFVYLSFHQGESATAGSFTKFMPGYAVYSAEEDEWTLYAQGELPRNTFGAATVMYFGPDYHIDGFDTLPLTSDMPMYCADVTYTTLGDNSVSIEANLKPQGVRIRFKNSSYYLTGMQYDGLMVATEWNRSESDYVYGDQLPANSSYVYSDYYYYTPYYTAFADFNNMNIPMIRLYYTSWSSSYRVRVFPVTEEQWWNGATYTVDADSYKIYGPYTTYVNNTTSTLSFSSATSTDYYTQTSLYSTSYTSKTGVHVKGNIKLSSILEGADRADCILGIKFETTDAYDSSKTNSEVFTFSNAEYFDFNTDIDFDFVYLDDSMGENQPLYYKVYIYSVGYNGSINNYSVTTF